MSLRFEVWTLPWSGDFHRVIAKLPVVEGSATGTTHFRQVNGDGTCQIPSDYPRLSEIVDDDTGTLIRVYDGQTIIHEWLAERDDFNLDDINRVVTISGPSLQAAFDKWLVYNFDYPADPYKSPDWQWGVGTNLIPNPSFEDTGFSNGGFEDGTTGYWGETDDDDDFNTPNNFVVVNNPSEARSGDYYGSLNPAAAMSGLTRPLTNLIPGETYTASLYMADPAGAGATYRIGVKGASSITGGGTEDAGYLWKTTALSGTSYTLLTITFVAVEDMATVAWVYWSGTNNTVRVDDFTATGPGIGLDGWTPKGIVNTLEQSTDWANDGTRSLKLNVTDFQDPAGGWQNSFAQRPIALTPGQTYTMEAIGYHTDASAQRFTLVMNRVGQLGTVDRENQMARAAAAVPGSTATKLVKSFVADWADNRIRLKWRDTPGAATTSPDLYWDEVAVYEGLPETTAGDIITTLLDHAALRGLFDWLDYSSFDDATDSASVAWDEDIAVSIPLGYTIGQAFDTLAALGYEWELVGMERTDPNFDPAGPTHYLRWYNPGGRDSDPSTAIIVRQGVTGGSGLKRIPAYTTVLVEGADGNLAERTDATAEADFGRTEKFAPHRDVASKLGKLALEVLDFEASNRRAMRFEVTAGPDWPRPLVTYRPGDTVPMIFPPFLPRQERRVESVSYVNTNPASYVVVGSQIYPGESGAWEIIRRMWRRFMRRNKRGGGSIVAGGGGGGSAPTVTIAHSDSLPSEKESADFVCDGANDAAIINAAYQAANNVDSDGGGRALHMSGIARPTGPLNVPDALGIEGMGWLSTQFDFSGAGGGDYFNLNVPTADVHLSKFTVFGNGTNDNGVAFQLGGGGGNMVLTDIWIGTVETAIDSDADVVILNTVRSHLVDVFLLATGGPSEVVVSNSIIQGDFIVDAATDFIVDGSALASCLDFGASENVRLSDSSVRGGSGTAGDAIFQADGALEVALSDLTVYTEGFESLAFANSTHLSFDNVTFRDATKGVYLDTCSYAAISRLRIGGGSPSDYLGQHGLSIVDCDDVTLDDILVIDPGQDADNTYDGLFVSGGSRVSARRVRVKSTLTSSPQPRYGINFASGSGHSYLDCEVYAAANFATAAYANAAGATNTWPAAGGAQGDNLV